MKHNERVYLSSINEPNQCQCSYIRINQSIYPAAPPSMYISTSIISSHFAESRIYTSTFQFSELCYNKVVTRAMIKVIIHTPNGEPILDEPLSLTCPVLMNVFVPVEFVVTFTVLEQS